MTFKECSFWLSNTHRDTNGHLTPYTLLSSSIYFACLRIPDVVRSWACRGVRGVRWVVGYCISSSEGHPFDMPPTQRLSSSEMTCNCSPPCFTEYETSVVLSYSVAFVSSRISLSSLFDEDDSWCVFLQNSYSLHAFLRGTPNTSFFFTLLLLHLTTAFLFLGEHIRQRVLYSTGG